MYTDTNIFTHTCTGFVLLGWRPPERNNGEPVVVLVANDLEAAKISSEILADRLRRGIDAGGEPVVDGFALVWSAGVQYQLTDSTSIGAAYQSRSKIEASGTTTRAASSSRETDGCFDGSEAGTSRCSICMGELKMTWSESRQISARSSAL